MRKWVLSALYWFCIFGAYSQNLVSNSSFENKTNCPSHEAEWSYCIDWYTPTNIASFSTPDYYNSCDTGIHCSVPNNMAGYGFQRAKAGNAYMGILAYTTIPNAREYLYNKLSKKLDTNQHYYISLYVSLSNPSMKAISTIGVFFSSNDTIPYKNKMLSVEAIVENPSSNLLNDTLNWIKISGDFIAKGGEQFLVIGNFRDDSHSGLQNTGFGFGDVAYYYIDDVCVSTSATECGIGVGIEDVKYSTSINVFPNPANEFVNINYRVHSALHYELYNSMGQLVDKRSLNGGGTDAIDVQRLSNGMYYMNIISNDFVMSRDKILVQH